MKKTAIVTGASSGFGLLTVIEKLIVKYILK